MARTFKLLVDRLQVSTAILSTCQINGVKVKVETIDTPKPDPGRRHPHYSLTPFEWATLVISVCGSVTALLQLATAILQLKKSKVEADSKTGPSDEQYTPIISIEDITVSTSHFSSPEMLADYLEAHLTSEEEHRE
jgi:hypothetical protein